MKFIYDGEYRQFRGYVFWNGPVEVTDRATIEACLKDPTFRKVDEEKTQAQTEILDPSACPKCGKVVKTGRYMHVKWCKG